MLQIAEHADEANPQGSSTATLQPVVTVRNFRLVVMHLLCTAHHARSAWPFKPVNALV